MPSQSTDTLWRYMKLSSLFLLLEGKAWFPSVASLRRGDPLESALGDDFYERLWNRLSETGYAEEALNWIAENRNVSPPDMEAKSDFGMIRSKVYGKFIADDLASIRAAWCWFGSDLESAAMWPVYGHHGVAIMTDTERLRESLPAGKEFRIEKMRYVDRRPCADGHIRNLLVDDPDLILRPYFLKAIEYGHECETRVVSHSPQGAKGLMVTSINSADLIREIVISPMLPLEEAEAIEKAIRLYPGLNDIDVRRSNLVISEPAARLVRSIEESMYGDSDSHIDTSKLPAALQNL